MCVALVSTVHAQMFSMDKHEGRLLQANVPYNEFFAGFEPTNIEYKGTPDVDGAGQYEYDNPILRVGYSGRALNLFMGVGGSITGSSNVAYFDVGGNLNTYLSLYSTKGFSLQLPFRISSRYVNMTNDQTAVKMESFRFGDILAGAGLQLLARPADDLRAQITAIPSYGFTFATGGFFGGGMGSFALNGRLFFDHLFSRQMGLSLGYKYDLRNYRVDRDRYDYRMQGHSIQVGITF